MTKADVVKDIAKSTGIEVALVTEMVDAFMESIKKALAKDENVYLRGFGSFVVKKRASKIARNISLNTTLTIPARHVPAFKPSKQFAEQVKANIK